MQAFTGQTLTGKVALVTGGSRGIGAATAKQLAQAGANVALTYLSAADRAQAVITDIEAAGQHGVALAADSADPTALVQAIEHTVSTFGRLDILVNNAGIFPFGLFENVTLEEINHTLAVHVRAVFVASQAAARHMTAGGRIISIGSSLADRVPYPGVSLYAMSKSALIGLTKGLARDLGARGITVTLVHPGNTDTDMNPADSPTAQQERGFIALGEYGVPEDVAAAVVWLAGDGGRYVTGTVISVDGGYAA